MFCKESSYTTNKIDNEFENNHLFRIESHMVFIEARIFNLISIISKEDNADGHDDDHIINSVLHYQFYFLIILNNLLDISEL
jgi:hypothetical protein